MAAGMWQGLLAGYKSVEEKKAAREAKEEELLRRRRSIAAALRPQIQAQREQVQTFSSGLSYLRDRGLSENTLNALAQDPSTFNAAMDFASTRGADMEPARLNEIFRASVVDDQAPQDALEYFNILEETLSGFEAVEDPEVFMENLPPLTPTRNTVVETRIPEAGREVTPAEQDSLWRNQAELFNQRVTELALETEQSLSDKEQTESGLTPEEQALKTQLGSDLNNDSDAAQARLRSLFAESVIPTFESSPEDFIVRFGENPYLRGAFISTQEEVPPQTEAPTPTSTHTPPSGGVLVGGVDPENGVMTFFYQMPDGTALRIKE